MAHTSTASAPSASDPSPSARSPTDRWARALPAFEVLLIVAVFYIQAGWPAPDINEAHYLGKARHYWNPAWRQNDFFLNTADAHQLFYWTFGWLTRWMPLAQAAWVGRVACWTLMACGWRRLSTAFAPGPFYSVLSAAVMVAMNEGPRAGAASDRFQLAGEWIVGGLEAKEAAFALVFFALADMVRGRWTRTWLLLGAASAFHVLVGGWSAIAAGVVWLNAGQEQPPLGRTLLAWAGAALLALPGLAPALALTWSADPATVADANRIYVFERLDHHLVFSSFPRQDVVRFALLAVFWALLAWLTPRGPAERRMRWFVGASLVVAAEGVAICYGLEGHERLAAALLRYYWFRLADAMVPVGVALAAVAYVYAALRSRPGWGAICLLALLVGAGAHLADVFRYRMTYPSPRSDWTVEDPEAWWSICDWVRDNTPRDAVFIVPRMAATFGWRTDRAEVVDRKDIPQDAQGIVQWWQRMRDLYWRPEGKEGPAHWSGSVAGLDRDRLIELGAKYGANYVVASAYPPAPLTRVSPPNQYYAVYKLPPRTARPASKAPPP